MMTRARRPPKGEGGRNRLLAQNLEELSRTTAFLADNVTISEGGMAGDTVCRVMRVGQYYHCTTYWVSPLNADTMFGVDEFDFFHDQIPSILNES